MGFPVQTLERQNVGQVYNWGFHDSKIARPNRRPGRVVSNLSDLAEFLIKYSPCLILHSV